MEHKKRFHVERKLPNFHRLQIFAVILLLLLGVIGLLISQKDSSNAEFSLDSSLNFLPEIVVSNSSQIYITQENCTYYTCFDVYKCGHSSSGKISIYIYPLYQYMDENGIPITKIISKEYFTILQTIKNSEYFTSDSSKACILVPSIDLLNQNHVRPKEVSKALASLPFWNEGRNHLVFNILPGSAPDYYPFPEIDLGYAMTTSGGFSASTFRPGFDVSIPVYSPLSDKVTNLNNASSTWLVLSSQTNIHNDFKETLREMALEHPNILVLDTCSDDLFNIKIRCRNEEKYVYPEIMKDVTFCLIVRGKRLGQPTLMDSLAFGCIPVLVADSYILPFSEVIDWKRAIVQIYEADLPKLLDIVREISPTRVSEMKESGNMIYAHYFSSIEKITLTTLRILNDRFFQHLSTGYSDWNEQLGLKRTLPRAFTLPIGPPRSQGFTAVVLTYDRMESLFQVLERISNAPSLAKIVVVWNNQLKEPLPPSAWPRLPKPLQIVRTKSNLLSNRFYPFPEIETEAILAMDDDIIMLTVDELEFGFEVWRQFPDRIVGFPSRTHVWDNIINQWKYESEWTNNISMILTGAAFYHRIYNYYYSTAMPGDIKTWVDDHMNCEDIAMNFLVANLTGKAPIKVAPRKKFKCPECVLNDVSVDLSDMTAHMAERSECFNRFVDFYGNLPLQTVEFRADPVLYKDNLPDTFKKFIEVGSL